MAYSRVFITGDIHGDYDIAKIDTLKEQLGGELKADPEDKLLLVCGDFGLIFEKAENDWERKIKNYYHALYEEYGLAVAACLGNHENYDRIYGELPLVDWWGDKARALGENGPWYLVNGAYYTVETTARPFTLLAMGGAASHDYPYRKAHVSWWPQEIPTRRMVWQARANLKKHHNEVDYIITHTIPYNLKCQAFENPFDDSLPHIRTVEKYLQKIFDQAQWHQWFAGHHHVDVNFPKCHLTILYNSIMELTPGEW